MCFMFIITHILFPFQILFCVLLYHLIYDRGKPRGIKPVEIKRNIKRFPNTFCFQLTETEFNNLKSQFAISSENNHGGVRYLPYVLTEQGIMMLSGLLKSDIAVKVNVQIIDALVNTLI